MEPITVERKDLVFNIRPRRYRERMVAGALYRALPEDLKALDDAAVQRDLAEQCSLIACTEDVVLKELPEGYAHGEAQRTFMAFWEKVRAYRRGEGVAVADFMNFFAENVIDYMLTTWQLAYNDALRAMTTPEERAPDLLTEDERADPN